MQNDMSISSHPNGCYHCFGSLDPQDKLYELREVVSCTHCNTIYHSVCWNKIGYCDRCKAKQSTPITLHGPVVNSTPILKTVAVSVIEPKIVYADDNRSDYIVIFTATLVAIILISLLFLYPMVYLFSSWVIYLVGVILTIATGFIGLCTASGLPPSLLLQQKLNIIQVGVRYYSYRQRCFNFPPTEQLLILIASKTKYTLEEQFLQAFINLHIVCDTEKIRYALDNLVRSGILAQYTAGYCLVNSHLTQALEKHEGEQNITILTEKICVEHPLYLGIQRFLISSGFHIDSSDRFGFQCSSRDPQWSNNSCLYVRVVLHRTLDMDELQALVKVCNKIYSQDERGRIAVVVIDRPPRSSDFHQIFALRVEQHITAIPLPYSFIVRSQVERREWEVLKEQIELYTGRRDLYDIHVAVTDILTFFGRQSLLADLKSRLMSGESVFICGVRKIGKSSLMGRLQEECEWPIAIIDMQGYIAGTHYAYEDIIKSWELTLQSIYPDYRLLNLNDWKVGTSNSINAQVFKQITQKIFDFLAKKSESPGLLLFLDEMDVLFSQPEYFEFVATLRSIVGAFTGRKRFSLLVAGLDPSLNRIDNFNNMRNPFYEFFYEIPLGPLSSEDVREMIVAIGDQMGVTYNSEALALVVNVCGGHPFLTRQLCSLTIRELERPITVTESRVRDTISEFLGNPYNYLAQSLWQIDQGGPPWAEQEILKSLAIKDSKTKKELITNDFSSSKQRQLEIALQNLETQSVLRKEKDRWVFSIPLYREWIRHNILF